MRCIRLVVLVAGTLFAALLLVQPAWAAVTSALTFLAVFWLVYDFICRSFGRRSNGDLIVGAAVFVALAALPVLVPGGGIWLETLARYPALVALPLGLTASRVLDDGGPGKELKQASSL